jgi:hypothetical protein
MRYHGTRRPSDALLAVPAWLVRSPHQAGAVSSERGNTVAQLWDEDVRLDDPNDPTGELPDDETEEDVPDYEVIFGAPDFDFLKNRKRPVKARQYEQRVQSLVKAGVFSSLHRGNLPDAAALIKTGPKFARALGDAAGDNEHIASALDMLTAPDSPIVPLVVTGLTLVSQLLRNHKDEAEIVAQNVRMGWREKRARRKAVVAGEVVGGPQATTTIKLPFGRKITLGFRLHLPGRQVWKSITGGAVPPEALVHSVFSDEALLKELARQGFPIRVRDDG